MTVVAAVIWIPLCLLLATGFGSTTMGFGIGGVMVVVTVVVGSTIFRRLKANRPPGYYQLIVHLWLAKHHLVKSRLVTRGGVWDLGRT